MYIYICIYIYIYIYIYKNNRYLIDSFAQTLFCWSEIMNANISLQKLVPENANWSQTIAKLISAEQSEAKLKPDSSKHMYGITHMFPRKVNRIETYIKLLLVRQSETENECKFISAEQSEAKLKPNWNQTHLRPSLPIQPLHSKESA